MGVDFAARGRRGDEAIDVLRLLWAGDENGVSFEGEFFSFTNLCSFPKAHRSRHSRTGSSSPADDQGGPGRRSG
jgi:alkanesulfonate monooxygenase SsuD/methylene tetrahydromethanopterin reductase-like flavin-dependent oxidoreductase (luciferase family)